MKSGPEALGTVKNESRSVKMPTVPSKMSLAAQNMKTGPHAIGTAKMSSEEQNTETGLRSLSTAKNEFGSVKHKNWIGVLGTAENESGAQNMKSARSALGTAQNKSRSAKHENWTRHPWYRPKRVRECKTWKLNLASSIPLKMSTEAQNMKSGPDALGIAENDS
jgi:hypothetical protein